LKQFKSMIPLQLQEYERVRETLRTFVQGRLRRSKYARN
jgi:hypothetical protein